MMRVSGIVAAGMEMMMRVRGVVRSRAWVAMGMVIKCELTQILLLLLVPLLLVPLLPRKTR
jgi:hypothetical protein